MKKVETISLKDLKLASEKIKNNKNIDEIDYSSFYKEKSQSIRNEHTLDLNLSLEEKMIVIDTDIVNFNNRLAKLLHTYFFLKLFSRTTSKSISFNEDSLSLDKYINELKKDYSNIKKQNNNYKKTENIQDNVLTDLYYQINDLYDFCRGLENDITNLQKTYYPVLKMASYSICSDKTYEEIDRLQAVVNKDLYSYKSVNEAYDYICYNSGELILEVTNMLLKILTKNNILGINYNFFLQSDAIIAFTYQEWIEYYAKVQYIKKKAGISKIYSNDGKYQETFFEFEKRYAIVLIYNEIISGIRKK